MRIQQERFNSEFVVNCMCLGIGIISSDSGDDWPESFSTTGSKNNKLIKQKNKSPSTTKFLSTTSEL